MPSSAACTKESSTASLAASNRNQVCSTVFTDSPVELVQAQEQHRDHAIVEQVFADWTDGPLAHLPSGIFPANAA
jgi:hypothetical protein